MYHALNGKKFTIDKLSYTVIRVTVVRNETVVEGKPCELENNRSRPFYFPIAAVSRSLVKE